MAALSFRIISHSKFGGACHFSPSRTHIYSYSNRGIIPVNSKSMAESAAAGKQLIRIDVSSDSVCPWCFVGKRNLDKAIAASKDQFDFKAFQGLGLEYNMDGLTGSTLDSHRLIYYAGLQDKQHDLVEELFLGYFTRTKYIGDREFLVESANKVGIEGAAEFLEDPNNGLNEVKEELRKYSSNINGVPYFVINKKQKMSGGQPPDAFLRAFQLAT